MSSTPTLRATQTLVSAALLTACAALAGCSLVEDLFGGGSSSSSDAYQPHTAKYASRSNSPIVVSGRWLVYLADEATSGPFGVNLNKANGDQSFTDQIAVLINMSAGTAKTLNVATRTAAILGNQIYLVVSEAEDSWDWDNDGAKNHLVLLHYPGTAGGSLASPKVEYVDTLDPIAATPALVVSNRLYYSASLTAPLGASESNLRWIDESAPVTPNVVLHQVAAAAGTGIRARILGQDENLLFLSLSESVEGTDLNNDGDATDGFVLALLDSTDPSAALLSCELAVIGVGTPLRAANTAAHDWLVAFLVAESRQDNFTTGLNDPQALAFPPLWFPSNCPSYSDTDRSDEVLHFLNFGAWSADPIGNPPQNTGLAGSWRLLATNGYLATLSPESDDGNCSTNGDGDSNDFVLRWVNTATPLEPYTDASQLVALLAVPGGTLGMSVLNGRFVATVSEALDSREYDDDPLVDNVLLGWLDPADPAPHWDFDHGYGPVVTAAGVSSMSESPQRDRLLIGYQESVVGKSLNPKDKDLFDSVPAFALFSSDDPDRLDFPFARAALSFDQSGTSNGGLVRAKNNVFFRVNEALDNRDWHADKFKFQDVLIRADINTRQLDYISPLNALTAPSIVSDGVYGAAFLVQEPMALRDYNKDGDNNDFVVRWVRFGS